MKNINLNITINNCSSNTILSQNVFYFKIDPEIQIKLDDNTYISEWKPVLTNYLSAVDTVQNVAGNIDYIEKLLKQFSGNISHQINVGECV